MSQRGVVAQLGRRVGSSSAAFRFGDLGLERLSLLLQLNDRTQTFVRVVQRAIALGGDDARVCGAESLSGWARVFPAKATDRVGTEEHEGEFMEIIPERFQAECSIMLAIASTAARPFPRRCARGLPALSACAT